MHPEKRLAIQLTRREFLKGAGLALVPLILSACGVAVTTEPSPTATLPTPTPIPTLFPFSTQEPPTPTSPPPTATPSSPTPKPTETAVSPTATSVPPTETLPPPTVTPVPPTATAVPPTATPKPPEKPPSLFPEPSKLVYPEAYLNSVENSGGPATIWISENTVSIAPLPPKDGIKRYEAVGNVLSVEPDGSVILGGKTRTGKDIKIRLKISKETMYLIVNGGGTWGWVSEWKGGNLGNIKEIQEQGRRINVGFYASPEIQKRITDAYANASVDVNLTDVPMYTVVVVYNAQFYGYK